MNQTTDTPHPTREEWEARQAALPDAARTAIKRYQDACDAERRERERLAEARAEELRQRLAGFELALHEVLAAHPWMHDYRHRAADGDCEGRRFTEAQRYWGALFDLTTLGLWPIRVTIGATDRDGFHWLPGLFGTIDVIRPNGEVRAADLDTALALAAEYARTPF